MRLMHRPEAGVMVIVLAALGWFLWHQHAAAEKRRASEEAQVEKRRAEQEEMKQTRAAALATCTRWADKLDAQTTETGIYIRFQGEELPEADPWGKPLTVLYSQGGFMEMLTIRSAGPDGVYFTPDDLVVKRRAVNAKGIGIGIKRGAGDTTAGMLKGAFKGATDTVKDEVKHLGKKR